MGTPSSPDVAAWRGPCDHAASMTESEIRAIALVRAVEETQPERIPAMMLVEAQLVAADPSDAPAWIGRRARYLAEGVLAQLRPLGEHLSLRLAMLGWVVPLGFVFGLAANYLGPSEKIHIVFNPIALLVLWNLSVYALLAARVPRPPGPRGLPLDVLGGALAPITQRLLRLGSTPQAGALQDRSALSRSYATSWLRMMRPVLGHTVRCMLHVAAIGTALGAVTGMYLRGLFFEYEVIWRSTFIDDPGTVAGMLRTLFAPAVLLLGQPWPSPADAVAMMSDAGSPAARWIHAFSATLLIAVLIPRALFALSSALRFQRGMDAIEPDMSDPYYKDLVHKAGQFDAKTVQASIHHDVRRMCETFRDEITEFVATSLYDARIARAIDEFRADGGKLRDLERRMRAECEGFQPTLEAEIEQRRRVLEARIAEQVAWRLGAVGPNDAIDGTRVVQAVGLASGTASAKVGDHVGSTVAAGVATTVSTAVGVVAGTLSGGFGHSLGTAILVGIVHSGPVGWILGAIGGAALAGAGFYLGRDWLVANLKRVSLPRTVARAAIGRVEHVKRDGRERCRQAVREALTMQLEASIDRIAEGIWQRLEPLLGERLRPLVRS
jgi:hypothetical protein